MPVVFRYNGFCFHFYSDEGDPREPVHVHVHVARDGADAKFWLYPEVTVAYNRGYDARTQNMLSKIITERKQDIEDAWHEYFG